MISPDDDAALLDDGVAGKQAAKPVRTCIVTRTAASPDTMVRFVVGPSGDVVPDLARRLPGRGVWVTLRRADIEKAIKQKSFARVLRRAVTVPADLTDMIERQLLQRVAETLSIANKAGLVVSGFAKVDGELTGGRAVALLHASDAAMDGCNKLDRKWQAVRASQLLPAPIFAPLTIDQLSLAMGKENVVHVALRSGGAALKFVEAADRLAGYCDSGKLAPHRRIQADATPNRVDEPPTAGAS